MALNRYRILDAYTMNELTYEYKNSDFSGKIKLFKRLQKQEWHLPYEVALMAVQDQDVKVRIWIAKHGRNLNYDHCYVDGKEQLQPERNLVNNLKNDSDPQVRAAFHENPDIVNHAFATDDEKCKKYFQESNHLERLALMRNPKIPDKLVETIFDPDDQSLPISLKERKELIMAFFANPKIDESRRNFWNEDYHDGYMTYLRERFFKNLWMLAAKWPEENARDVKKLTYLYINTDDEMKSKTYILCVNELLRSAILENCDQWDTKTLALGKEDKDDTCRYIAYCRMSFSNSDQIENILNGNDEMALSALASNKNLPIDMLEKVKEKLSELGDDFSAKHAQWNIEELEKKKAPQVPEELFGWEGRKGNFLQDKIDFIGKRLLKIENDLKGEIKECVHSTDRRVKALKTIGIVILLMLFVLLFLK
jgi:hypothetical protein